MAHLIPLDIDFSGVYAVDKGLKYQKVTARKYIKSLLNSILKKNVDVKSGVLQCRHKKQPKESK